MTVIDLNEIYKKIYYKYILSFRVLDMICVKHSQSFKTYNRVDDKYRGLRVVKNIFFDIYNQFHQNHMNFVLTDIFQYFWQPLKILKSVLYFFFVTLCKYLFSFNFS